VYYLIIDRQRGTENVYFLSPVTEEDLLGLADSGTIAEPAVTQPEPRPSADTPEPTGQPEEESPAQSGGLNLGTIIFVLIGVAVVGGAAYYIKIIKPRQQARDEDEYEEDFEDEEPGEDEYFFEGEDAPVASDSADE
jgi:hypothetical protein